MPKSIIATWPFSRSGVLKASTILQQPQSDALKAVEKGIQMVELDTSVTSVGYGGLPNASGILELDAALMTSNPPRQGSVMSVPGIRSAIPLARLILLDSNTPHSIISGEGARSFAEKHNIRTYSSNDVLTDYSHKRYGEFLSGRHVEKENKGHTDTVGMLAYDGMNNLVAGCATSGMQFKMPGRVGDAPVFGAGLYADENGAASASGDGDRMLRFCLSFYTVERMRQGASATNAARDAIKRVLKGEPGCQAAIVAMDPEGGVGAAATHDGFVVVVWDEDGGLRDLKVDGVIEDGMEGQKWEHSCI